MPQSFVDKETNQPVFANTDAEVQAALANPRLQPLGPVAVTTPSGTPIQVDEASARNLLEQGGAPTSGVALDEAGQRAAEAKRFDSPGAAAALGGLRTLTFGASDKVIGALGGDYELAKLKEHNELATLGGELSTAFLPVGAPGLVSRAAKAAGEAVRGASTASKIGAAAVEAAVDGGAWNAAQQVSNSVLADDPLTPESLLAAAGLGGVLGGVTGGGLASVGAISSGIRKKVLGKANPLLHSRSPGAKEFGQHFGQVFKEADAGVDDALKVARDARELEIVKAQDAARAAAKAPPAPPVVNPMDELLAQETPLAKTVPGKKREPGVAEPLDKTAPGKKRRGGSNRPDGEAGEAPDYTDIDLGAPPVHEPGVSPVADTELAQAVPAPEATIPAKGKRDTLVDALPEGRAAGALAKDAEAVASTQIDNLPYGAEMGAIKKDVDARLGRKQAEKAAKEEAAHALARKQGLRESPYTPRVGEAPEAFAKRIAAHEQQNLAGAYKAVRRKMVEHFGEEMAVDFAKLSRQAPEEAFKALQAVDNYANIVERIHGLKGNAEGIQARLLSQVEGKATPEVLAAFKGLSGMDAQGVADALGVAADKVPTLGPVANHVLKAYAVNRFSEGALAKAAANAAEARVGSAVDGLKAAGGGVLGMAKNAAFGAALKALGAPSLTLLRLATKVGKVKDALAQGVDAFIQASTGPRARRALVRGGVEVFDRIKFSDKEDKKDGLSPPMRRIKELQELAGNPARLETYVDDQLAAVRAHNLDVGYKTAEVVKKATMFVASKMPHVPPRDPFTGWQPEPSKADLNQWARYLEAVEKGPVQLLDELNAGDLAHETIEAVKEIYPGLFETVRARLIEKVIDQGTPVHYQDRLNLSQLFDVPVEPTQAPETVFALQEMYAMQEQHQDAPRPQGTPKPPSMTKGQQFSV